MVEKGEVHVEPEKISGKGKEKIKNAEQENVIVNVLGKLPTVLQGGTSFVIPYDKVP